MTAKTLSALYDTYDDAVATVRDIVAAGVAESSISIVSNNTDRREASMRRTNAASGGAIGAEGGMVAGAGVGLLASLGVLAIPGIGPVLAVGALATTLVGAAVGADVGFLAGGLVGSLSHAGVSQEEADVFAKGVRRGGTLITAKVEEAKLAQIEAILRLHRPVDMVLRGKLYRGRGWERFDEKAAPYTVAELKYEQEFTRNPPPAV